MTTVTLDEIKSAHAAVANLIAQYEAQAKEQEAILFPESLIKLSPGEHYAGLIVGKDGNLSYHLILMAGEAESINWKDAQAWAKGQSGELPNRREQALLFANLKEQFQPRYYWSSEQHASASDCAWIQHFDDGGLYYHLTDYQLRARAVRRLPI